MRVISDRGLVNLVTLIKFQETERFSQSPTSFLPSLWFSALPRFRLGRELLPGFGFWLFSKSSPSLRATSEIPVEGGGISELSILQSCYRPIFLATLTRGRCLEANTDKNAY